MKYFVTLVALFFSASQVYAADTPKNIRNEVDKLAGLNSALNSCLSSKEGKRLGSAQWLEIQKKSMKIDDFVVATGEYFKDSFLFTSYELAGNDYKNEGKIESNVLARYKSICSLEMQHDVLVQVDAIEKTINELKPERNKKQR